MGRRGMLYSHSSPCDRSLAVPYGYMCEHTRATFVMPVSEGNQNSEHTLYTGTHIETCASIAATSSVSWNTTFNSENTSQANTQKSYTPIHSSRIQLHNRSLLILAATVPRTVIYTPLLFLTTSPSSRRRTSHCPRCLMTTEPLFTSRLRLRRHLCRGLQYTTHILFTRIQKSYGPRCLTTLLTTFRISISGSLPPPLSPIPAFSPKLEAPNVPWSEISTPGNDLNLEVSSFVHSLPAFAFSSPEEFFFF